MTVDVFTGNTDTQTQTIALTTAWGDCAFSYSITPTVSWLSDSVPSTGQLKLDVTSTKMSLAGTTTLVSITFIPSYRDCDGYPADVTYSFYVNL